MGVHMEWGCGELNLLKWVVSVQQNRMEFVERKLQKKSRSRWT